MLRVGPESTVCPVARIDHSVKGSPVSHEREIAEEQAFLAQALTALEGMRNEARGLRDMAAVAHLTEAGDLVERDVVMNTALVRLEQLAIGDAPLFFGRIDYAPSARDGAPSYHVGRLAVTDAEQEPLVVDWRAPIAEAFYRATGVDALGLARRRHISMRDNVITSVEDEYFAGADGELALPDDDVQVATKDGLLDGGLALGGPAALLAALGRARTGQMGDIVATIQGEQDRIIRAPLSGILLVQGGPGTGKTAVALHRAAYLLYTHRGELERNGVLVVGPNPLFLNYIENVLPSLGESGVTLSTVSGLVRNVAVRATESEELARLKGDVRMAEVIARAVAIRQRALREDVKIPFGRTVLTVTAAETAEVVSRARRRPGNHNSRRSAVGRELARKLVQRYESKYATARSADAEGLEEYLRDLEAQIRALPEFKQLVQRIWPRLTGQDLIHDLFGAPALIRAAGRDILSEDECELLVRQRSASLADVPWTVADLALIDEARVHLGPRKRPKVSKGGESEVFDFRGYSEETRQAAMREAWFYRSATNRELDEAEFEAFGHIVIDEAQDLSPMQLRCIKRRDLSGSMTIVGDMGQATTAASSASWEATLDILEPRRSPTRVDLSVSYRTPEEVLTVAAPTLRAATSEVEPPRAVRRAGIEPIVARTRPEQFVPTLLTQVQHGLDVVAPGRLAVIVTTTRVGEILRSLNDGGFDAVDPEVVGSRGLAADLVVIGAEGSNGLEFDGVIVLEPAEIAARGGRRGSVNPRGLRTLYVAMTRPTRLLTLVSSDELPASLQEGLENVAKNR
jgi:DNA helicase IV